MPMPPTQSDIFQEKLFSRLDRIIELLEAKDETTKILKETFDEANATVKQLGEAMKEVAFNWDEQE